MKASISFYVDKKEFNKKQIESVKGLYLVSGDNKIEKVSDNNLLSYFENVIGDYSTLNQEIIINLDGYLSIDQIIYLIIHESIHAILDETETLHSAMQFDNVYRAVQIRGEHP